MQLTNALLGAALAGLLWPFQSWPIAGLAVVSLLVALIVLAIFAAVSNQRALAVSKRRMQAGLFELRLFQDDPAIVLRAAGALCREQVSYLRHALAPLLVLALPLTLVVSHLHVHYGYAGLRPGEPALVTVRLKTDTAAGLAGAGACARLAMTAPDGLRVDSPCVWTPSLREAAWRLQPTRDGAYDLRITWDAGEAVTKRVQVSPAVVARAPVRPPPTLWAQLSDPGEAPLPSSSVIESIGVTYPPAAIVLFGLPLHWLIVFFLLSAAFTLVFRSAFGVVI